MKISLIDFFREPPVHKLIKNNDIVKKQYKILRQQLFISCFIAYFTFYLCKKNMAVAFPELNVEFGYTNFQLGLIGSSLYFTYGLGKFINGILIEKCNVQKVLPMALIITAVLNFLIVFFSLFNLNLNVYLILLILLWGMNGWIQSIAFPAIIKTLTHWFSRKERGTVISLWSPSHLIGIFVSAILSGALIVKFGWRMVFFVPGIVAIFIALILFLTMKDKPQSIGLPEIDSYKNEADYNNWNNISSKEDVPLLGILKTDILCNKTLWLLAVIYIFVYIIRLGTEDWLVKYLYDVKGNSIDIAAKKLCILPLVGIFGSVLAGIVSDKFFKSKRLPVNIIFFILLIFSLLGLKYNKIGIIDYFYISILGIGVYGVQFMIGGLCAIESTSKKMAAAATGFTGLFGYLGAFLSSICTGSIIDNFGWNGAIVFWILCAVSSTILCIFIGYFNIRKD